MNRSFYIQGSYVQRPCFQGSYVQSSHIQGSYILGSYIQESLVQGSYVRWSDVHGPYLQGSFIHGFYLLGSYVKGFLHPADLRKSSTVLSARSVRTQTYFRSTLLPEIRLCSQAAPRALAFSFDVNVIETLSILGQGQVFHSIYAPCCKTMKTKKHTL